MSPAGKSAKIVGIDLPSAAGATVATQSLFASTNRDVIDSLIARVTTSVAAR